MSYRDTDERDTPRITPAVQWLIALNVLVYFLQLTIVPERMLVDALAFNFHTLTTRPWTIVTYMFVHAGFWHLALNMYGLWLFGTRVEHAWSSAAFTRYYLLCGLGAWLAELMFFRDATLLGASGGVFGVMVAYAMRWPDDELLLYFVIPIKIKWAVMLFAGFSLAAGIGSGGGGVAHFAHLGGMLTGWLYLRWLQGAPSLDSLRQRMSQAPDVPDDDSPPRAIPRPRPRERERMPESDEVVARSNALTARRSTRASLASKSADYGDEELNAVLDKISRQGLESLTRDEKRLLEEMSRRLRDE
jgi:membrane associated rhomboid family serine protease